MQKTVLVLDFGSQYTQLIARKIRELGVYSEIIPCTKKPTEINLENITALILSGGPSSVTDDDAPVFSEEWLKLGLPTLGICYGMQLISHLSGAKLERGKLREYGNANINIKDNQDLFAGFDRDENTTVWMSHGDHVDSLPEGFSLLASSPTCPFAAIANRALNIYGIQFHPEVVHSPRGKEVLSNFIFNIAKCQKNWSTKNFIGQAIAQIKEQVPENANVICALSGGVDSSVAAVLIHKAIGDRLHCIFVDNGLLRKNEAERVMNQLGLQGLGLNIKKIDARAMFVDALKGVIDPEKKRKKIGKLFIDVFDEESKKIPNVTHLVQGTLYPDVIESVSVRGPSATIKTHHNVGGLPENMKLKLIEPFRELFKDEVRELGREMGIDDTIIRRQPFPGPGLAVRIIGEINEKSLETLKDADAIFLEEIRAAGLYQSIWQSFAVLLPVKSVGVMGDGRTYENTIALRAVHSDDGMTADWCDLPGELLRRTSNRIINEVRGVNRVVYDISSKPPATIEWE